ncbi:MerR family transcriptional regulator [Nocardia vinacea]|uniref:MerR family transcriptional regulator n=1 Tax=Nocardia vinacea TaxID=96468 RepID=UPI00030F80E6|nr:MerR family transcriptional regulator [Nocardia vinacea]
MPHRSMPARDQAGYSVRTAAERLGIPTATLRSWNRRYGIGPQPERPGRHRLYTEADIGVLTRMLDLIRAGATPAGAAATARGPALAFGDRQALLSAAFALDTPMVCELLDKHVRTYGVVDTWDHLCRPAFAEIVARQLDGEGCVDVEHLLSWCIIATLHRTVPPTRTRDPVPTILACTSGESHSLPLEVARAALAERGTGAQLLGPDVPTAALHDTLTRITVPAAVMLWSQQAATALTSAVLACINAGARIYLGGPGWDHAILPDTVIRIGSLAETVERLGRTPV